MIFATVGTQLPFDRMIKTINNWSIKQGVKGCFAQIGTEGVVPSNIASAASLTPLQFAKRIADCKVIVSHAGMGTILSALSNQKPIIIMPRMAKHGEHRNDHQMATANKLQTRRGIYVAWDEADLMVKLDELSSLEAGVSVSTNAQPSLIAAVSHFVGSNCDQGLSNAHS